MYSCKSFVAATKESTSICYSANSNVRLERIRGCCLLSPSSLMLMRLLRAKTFNWLLIKSLNTNQFISFKSSHQLNQKVMIS